MINCVYDYYNPRVAYLEFWLAIALDQLCRLGNPDRITQTQSICTCNNSHGDVHLRDRLSQGCRDGTRGNQESTQHDNRTITKAVTRHCGKGSCREDVYSYNHGHSMFIITLQKLYSVTHCDRFVEIQLKFNYKYRARCQQCQSFEY